MNPIFQAVANSSSIELNTAIIQGAKINSLNESTGSINVLEYAIFTLKYSMVPTILNFVALLPEDEKKSILDQGLKTLLGCIEKYLQYNINEDLSDDLAVFDQLKNAGADLNLKLAYDDSLYHYSIKYNLSSIFNTLIDANIDSNVLNSSGYDPVLYSFIFRKLNFVETLIERSNNLTIQDNYTKKSLLHLAVEADRYDLVQTLLTKEPSLINLVDYENKTALHYVARDYEKEKAKTYIDYLVSKNINVNAQDYNGNTALHYAVERNGVKLYGSTGDGSGATGGVCHCLVKNLIASGGSLYIKNKQNEAPIECRSFDKCLLAEIC